jgi:hypothetical protein
VYSSLSTCAVCRHATVAAVCCCACMQTETDATMQCMQYSVMCCTILLQTLSVSMLCSCGRTWLRAYMMYFLSRCCAIGSSFTSPPIPPASTGAYCVGVCVYRGGISVRNNFMIREITCGVTTASATQPPVMVYTDKKTTNSAVLASCL